MIGKPFALSAYPLSRDYRIALEREVGAELDYLTLPQLRRLRAGPLVRALREFRGRPALLPFEDAASLAVLPILHALSVVASPSGVEVIHPGLDRQPLATTDLPLGLFRLAWASVQGARAAAAARRELVALAQTPRASCELTATRRILFLNPNLWFGLKVGGSVGHLAGVVNGFAESEYDVDLFTATDPVLIRPEIRVTRLAAPSAFGLPHELNLHAFQRQVLRQTLREARPPYDFVYQRLSVANYAGVALSRQLGLPLVLEYNGSEVWAARHWSRPLRYETLAQAAEDVSIAHAHVVVTVSDVLREELVERGVPPERIACYPNCVDTDLYDARRFGDEDIAALRARHGIDRDACLATFIGTFGHWHGADLLARAIAALVDDDEEWVKRQQLHFMLVGDGLKMPEVRAILDHERYAPYVTLTGLVPQEEGPAHLAASDLLLSPHVPNPDGTPFFGSPTKLFEYMATGKPIVASALNQISDVLTPALSATVLPSSPPTPESAEVAVLTEPGNAADVLRAVRFLVERPDWRRVLGANARRTAEERFTWRRHVQETLERLSSLGPRL
jgi:glycosyltransferase involved in cell wall biosynthesis